MSDGKKALADKAIALGSAQAKRRYDASLPGPSFVEKIQHSILDALILKKVRGAFCLLYTSPSPRDQRGSRMPSSA